MTRDFEIIFDNNNNLIKSKNFKKYKIKERQFKYI